jgi:hypothetical protein
MTIFPARGRAVLRYAALALALLIAGAPAAAQERPPGRSSEAELAAKRAVDAVEVGDLDAAEGIASSALTAMQTQSNPVEPRTRATLHQVLAVVALYRSQGEPAKRAALLAVVKAQFASSCVLDADYLHPQFQPPEIRREWAAACSQALGGGKVVVVGVPRTSAVWINGLEARGARLSSPSGPATVQVLGRHPPFFETAIVPPAGKVRVDTGLVRPAPLGLRVATWVVTGLAVGSGLVMIERGAACFSDIGACGDLQPYTWARSCAVENPPDRCFYTSRDGQFTAAAVTFGITGGVAALGWTGTWM